MNLINCSKNCIHQRDGQCTLETAAPVSDSKVDGCCYFRARDSAGDGRDNNLGTQTEPQKGTVI